MNPFFLSMYKRLPPFLKNLAASVHGYRLNRLRYGRYFRDIFPVVIERESYSRLDWAIFQKEKLRRLLSRAVECVPHYRRLYERGKFPISEVSDPTDLNVLPILEKEILRRNPMDFLADNCDLKHMYEEHTSGTTGTPIRLFWSHRTQQEWYAIFEQRMRRWNGVQWGDHWAILGGQLVVPVSRKKPPFWVWIYPSKQLYLSVYHLSGQFLDSYLDEIKRRNVRYIIGYPSAMHTLACHALESGRRDIQLEVAVGNAEPFLAHQRRHVEKAFGCVTRESYGNAELVSAAFECERGSLHLAPDVGIVEVLDPQGKAVAAGETGELVCTSLINQDHILIRYRTGDLGRMSRDETSCSCGRQMPVIEGIEGRTDDVITTPDGRIVGRMDPVFKIDVRVKAVQIAQVAPDRLVARCVPSEGFGKTDEMVIRERIKERVGDMSVDVVIVTSLAKTESGKFKAVVNEMQLNSRIP